VDVSERVRALRKRVDLTQAQVAERAGLDRVEVSQIEGGKNSCGSWRVRAGLARAFGVRVDTVADYLDGAIGLQDVLDRRAAGESSGNMRAVKCLLSRPEWAAALAAAQAAAAVTDPEIVQADWVRVSQLYDGPSVPNPLTPRLILQLARALRNT
jgi:transcriptional regulator with XRE-family HTH domain